MPATISLDKLCHDYRRLLSEQQQLELRIACCTRQSAYSPVMRERLTELGRQRRTLLAGQRATAQAIHRHTAALPDERLRTIIELRYLDNMPWAQVSEMMGLELRWLMRLHRRALNIGKPDNKKSLTGS